ncbi:hypothetical protein N9934_01480 [Desulfosarcina sp.]|nr:hypothetical protein [Desulfosarcina sp.]
MAPGFKFPEQLETFSMPTHHGLGFDNDQNLLPVAPETGKDNPEKTVSAAKLRPFDRPFHGGHLLAKRKVFQSQIEILFRPQKYFKEQF